MKLARAWLLLVCVWALSVGIGCKRQGASPPAMPPAKVTVATPLVREIVDWDVYTGRMEATDSVDVRARVTGFIEAAPFEEGLMVKRGDVLFVIDARPFQAKLDAAMGDQVQAEAKLQLAKDDLARAERPFKNGALSLEEYDTRKQAVKQAEGALAVSKATVAEAQLDVDWCKVTAPISGRVSKKRVTPGNLVSGGEGAATVLTTITSINPIYCYVDADERSVLKYSRLAAEKKRVSARDAKIACYLALSDETGFPHEGVIDFVDNRFSASTGTIQARGVFSNQGGLFVPGMFVRLRVAASAPHPGLLIPDEAIGTDQNRKFVFIVNSDDIVETRSVKLGSTHEGLRSVESGLSASDRVIVNGILRVRPKMKVTPQLVQLDGKGTIPVPTTASASTAPAEAAASQVSVNGVSR